MELLEDADEALLVDELLLRGEGIAAAQFGEHVIHARERQLRVQCLPGLAVRVQLLAEGTNAHGQRAVGAVSEISPSLLAADEQALQSCANETAARSHQKLQRPAGSGH